MKLLILYQPKSEHARSVEDFVRNFKQHYSDTEVVLMDVDSVEGTENANLYDIVQYPAFLAIIDDGTLLNSWTGPSIPLTADVKGYLR